MGAVANVRWFDDGLIERIRGALESRLIYFGIETPIDGRQGVLDDPQILTPIV